METKILLLLAVLLTGMVCGLFYGYQCSVTGGLGKLPDKEYIRAFQEINKAILNPWFFASFLGSLLILPLATWRCYHSGAQASFYFLLAATIVYVIGVFGMTMVRNVPLNDTLASLDLNALPAKELFTQRKAFEAPWNHFHLMRTIAAVLSFLLATGPIFPISISMTEIICGSATSLWAMTWAG